MSHLHLHLVSDSTGETVHAMARAGISQFEGIEVTEHNWPLTRSQSQIDRVMEAVREKPGVIMYTMVDEDLREALEQRAQQANIPHLSVLDPIIGFLGNYLGIKSAGRPGRQHAMDQGYFKRIEAMQYAVAHDDGQGLWDIADADVIITGVSRTSKSPTCIYLANRGLKAANVPFVPGVILPEELLNLGNDQTGPLVVGLTKDPERLVQIRRNRLRMISEDEDTDYTDLETVKKEVAACRRLCAENGWPVIDVSRRSIEETAAAIIRYLEIRNTKLDQRA